MNNLRPKLVLSFTIAFIALLSCRENKSNTNLESNSKDSTTQKYCDSLLPIAIELIKLDSVEFEMGTGFYLPKFNFNHYSRQSKSAELVPFQIEVHDSLILKHIWESKGFDTLFTQQNVDQFYARNEPLDPECYPQYNFISQDSLRKRRELYEQDFEAIENISSFSFSRPLVSTDCNYMYMQFDHHCYGLCGSGHVYLFQRSETGWEKVWSFMCWIS